MINKVTVLTVLNNLMGKVNQPSGTTADLERYCQEAFNYAWRYYKWSFSLKQAVVAADGVLPEDFDPDSFHAPIGGSVTYVPLADAYAASSGVYGIFWNSSTSRFNIYPAQALTIVYQPIPPTLSADVNVPFPSAQVIAIGASIYAKSAANPTRADVSQEWDMFHDELDRLVARSYSANTPHKAKNRYDLYGIGTGES